MTSTQQHIRAELDLAPEASDEEVLAAIRELKPAVPVMPAWSFPPPPGPIVF